MSLFTKKNYFIFVFVIILLFNTKAFGKDTKFKYSEEDVSNYFSGVISLNQNYDKSFDYLNKVKSLKNTHYNFNVQFIQLLVLLKKFDKAFVFSKNIWNQNELLFEADLLLGLRSFIEKDYVQAEKHFKRLNKVSNLNFIFDDFLGNILLTWVNASQKKQEESFNFLNKVPNHFNNLKKIQNSFLQCYFNTTETEIAFEQLINSKEYNFSRYNFFLANYFLHQNKKKSAEILIARSRNLYSSNILIKQTENFILNEKSEKIKKLFNCENPQDVLAEIFYVMANLYSSQKNYQLSNFYLRISLFLNKKFEPNKSLLAENFYYEKKFNDAKEIYSSIKSIGPVYSWYASRSIAVILQDTLGKEPSVSYLEKEFNLLSNHDFEHYYELANFYKDNEYYEKSIKYYSLALNKIDREHYLFPKILDRRGTSYERLGDWEKAEKDLKESLQILPDQPYVLNYLAYSWTEKGMNINKALEMLKRATKLKENDGYILDSLGWAYFANKNYINAERFLQRAVELMPQDPIINDHYADALWMLNKTIQARYFWNYVLKLDSIEEDLKKNINNKLIFGIKEKL